MAVGNNQKVLKVNFKSKSNMFFLAPAILYTIIFRYFYLATVNILASDDGHGVLSFNTSDRFLLREPTSVSQLSDSEAKLFVVRSPEEGTFGTVSVQFTVTDANGSLTEGDVMPTHGLVVLEDGVRFKVGRSRT